MLDQTGLHDCNSLQKSRNQVHGFVNQVFFEEIIAVRLKFSPGRKDLILSNIPHYLFCLDNRFCKMVIVIGI